MWLVKLSWKNLWRNRQRTAITMSSIFFSVILSVLTSSLKAGIFDNLIQDMVGYYSGYIQIHKNGYWDEPSLENGIELGQFPKTVVEQFSGISSSTTRLESFSLASFEKNTKGCLVLGIDAMKEGSVTNLGTNLLEGKSFQQAHSGIHLAEGLKHRLQVSVGDSIVLLSQGYHGSLAAGQYAVQGVFKTGSPDLNNTLLLLPINMAQELFGADSIVTSVVLTPSGSQPVNKLVEKLRVQLGNSYEVMSWEEMMPDIKQHIEADTINLQVIQGILYLLICFGIFGTLLMMMEERKTELGMLLAIGMKKYKLMLVLAFESLLTIAGGCLIGIVASMPLVFYLNRYPIQLRGSIARAYERFGFEAIFPTSVAAEHFWKQALVVLTIGLVLSLYPVYKIWKMEAVTSIKK